MDSAIFIVLALIGVVVAIYFLSKDGSNNSGTGSTNPGGGSRPVEPSPGVQVKHQNDSKDSTKKKTTKKKATKKKAKKKATKKKTGGAGGKSSLK